MGTAGLTTINSGRVLETLRIETLCRLPLVTTIEAAGLVVFTVNDPKLNDAGVTPTPACSKMGKNTKLARDNPTARHTRLVLSMAVKPRIPIQERDQNERRVGYLSSLVIFTSRESIGAEAFSDYW